MVNKNSRHKGRRSSFTSNGKKKKKTPKNVKGTSIRRKKSKKRKQKLQIERMSTMRGGATDDLKNIENMNDVFGQEKVEKFQNEKTLHMVCGLAGEYCVLDTAVNLGLHFPQAHVLYLDNYTEYAAFNKMFIHSPGFLSDCYKKLNEMSSKNNFYRQKELIRKIKYIVKNINGFLKSIY